MKKIKTREVFDTVMEIVDALQDSMHELDNISRQLEGNRKRVGDCFEGLYKLLHKTMKDGGAQ